ncbi:MBL fold metallo-hydrolase [Herbaspirillum sp. B65]|uniref:MBL fold metallo-hydrolase n=1 Tax=Herbaspirillum sp. B65 TaxID=137708 RepID=UPI0005C9AA26|nr:MBL fold metallo-hydrolase [Herbaspirillum sp. B65]
MMPIDQKRRHLLQAILGAPVIASEGLPASLAVAAPVASSEPMQDTSQPRQSLPPWQPGLLDIHHIATGRGNATLMVLPDGTTLLMDAGDTADGPETSFEPRPNASRRAGEWIGRYLQRRLRDTGGTALDYLFVTHFHPDHTGDPTPRSPRSGIGDYALSGVTDVAEIVPITTVVDRGYPSYDYPTVWKAPFAANYFSYIKSRVDKKQDVQRFQVGTERQFVGKGYHAASQPFSVRNLVASGEVWTGRGEDTIHMFPPLASLERKDYPNENLCSAGIRVDYGNFRYFSCADLTSYTYDGDQPWRDVLTAAARAAGRVDVATADHHCMFDGLSADTVRLLRPQAWMIHTWHISHPEQVQLERLFSERLYPGPRDVFATTVMKENLVMNHRLLSRLKSTDGHIVVRVAADSSFHIFVTDDRDERDTIKMVSGPYQASRKA